MDWTSLGELNGELVAFNPQNAEAVKAEWSANGGALFSSEGRAGEEQQDDWQQSEDEDDVMEELTRKQKKQNNKNLYKNNNQPYQKIVLF